MYKREKQKGRSSKQSFAGLPHAVLSTHKYTTLSAWGVKLLVDVTAQYTGSNNGDLQASWSVLQHKGWHSSATLYRAIQELLRAGFIQKTRQGGRNKCSLYGITWKPIDRCPDKRTKMHKLDVQPTQVAVGTWKDEHREAA